MKRPWMLLAVGLLVSCGDMKESPLLPSSFEGWKKTTDLKLNYPIPGHMDNYREIFINPQGEGVKVEDQNGKAVWNYPEGAILAKFIYGKADPGPGEAPVAVTAMVKAPADSRSQGGWIWLVKDLSSGSERVFREEFCLACHGDANENHPYGKGNPNREFRDYVFFPYKSAEASAPGP